MAAALGTLLNKIKQIGSHSPDEPRKEADNAFVHDQTTSRALPNLRSTKRSLSPHQLEDTLLQKPLYKKQKISEEEKRLVLPRTNHTPSHASSDSIAISTSKWIANRPTRPARMTRKVAARGAVTPMNTLSKPTFQSTKNQTATHSRPTMTLETKRVTGDNVAGFGTSSITTNSPSTKRQKLDHTTYFSDHGDSSFGHNLLESLSRPTQPARKPSSISINSQDSSTRSKEEPFRANEARHVDRMLMHKKPRKPKSTSASSSQAERIVPDFIDLDSKPPSDSMQMKPPAKRGSAIATDDDVAVIIEPPAIGMESPENKRVDQIRSDRSSPVIHVQNAYDALNSGNRVAKSQNRTPMRDKFSRDTSTDTKPTPLSRPSLRKSMQVSSSESADRRRAEGSEDELAISSANKFKAVKSVRPTSPTAIRSTPRTLQMRQKEDSVQIHNEEAEDGNTFKLSSFFTLSAQITDGDLTLSFLPSMKCFVPKRGGAPVLASNLYQNHAQTVVANPAQSLRLGMIGSKDGVTGGSVWVEFCTRRDLEICLGRLSWLKNNGVSREVDSNKYSRNGIEHQFQAALRKFDFERQRNAAKETKSDATPSRQVTQELDSTTSTREQIQDIPMSTSRLNSYTSETPKTSRVKAMQSDYSERSPHLESQSSPQAEKASPSSLRSTRTSSRLQAKDTVEKPREPELERWTRNNPPLKWDSPLVYPANGPKRTTVEATDVERLDNGEFLNDNIISFCLRHLEEGHPELKDKVHIFNTFFYTSLSTKQGKRLFNYDAVKRWTKNIDIFSYPFVVVPVNANLHWFVTIICNLDKLGRKLEDDGEHEEANKVDNEHDMLDNTISGDEMAGNGLPMELPDSQEEPATEAITMEVDKLSLSGSEKRETGVEQVDDNGIVFEFPGAREPSEKPAIQKSVPARKGKKKAPPISKLNPNQTAVITLDSLGGTHSVEVRNLKDYVVHEGQEKRGMTIAREDIKGLLAKGIPEQTNFCDCGVYLVGYITEFLKDPTEFVRKVMSREIDRNNDFADFDPIKKREEIRNALLRLEQEQREAKRERKRAQREAKRTASGQLDGTSESPASGRDNSNDAATPAMRNSPEGGRSIAAEQDTKDAKGHPTATVNEGEARPQGSQPVVLSHREKSQGDNGGVQLWAELQEAAQE